MIIAGSVDMFDRFFVYDGITSDIVALNFNSWLNTSLNVLAFVELVEEEIFRETKRRDFTVIIDLSVLR